MNQAQPATPIPSATVVLLRDGAPGLEVLLLLRNHVLTFAPAMWVFPGGRLDPADYSVANQGSDQNDNPERLQQAARNAACREAFEEAGVLVQPEKLRLIDHFVTPEVQPKRFSTWFYLTDANGCGEVSIDNGEIVDQQWLTPSAALDHYSQGELSLMRPTRKVLEALIGFGRVDEALLTD